MSARIRTAIVEDEPLARRRLERLVSAREDLELVASFDGPPGDRMALAGVELLFLDVEMPGEDGFAFLESLPRGAKPYVIFATAHERHALRAIRHDAVDFLLKPFDGRDFEAAVSRARQRIDAGRGEPRGAPGSLVGVRVLDGDANRLLPPREIDWIRAEGRAILVSAGGRVLRASGRLSDFEARLAELGFLRVHRSCLVNLRRVRSVLARSHGDRTLVLEDGQRVEMSRHYAARFDALTL